jgi:hypothetical protein
MPRGSGSVRPQNHADSYDLETQDELVLYFVVTMPNTINL